MKPNHPEILYHYTTMNSLWNILNNITNKGDKDNPDYFFKIWVSCAQYMNDPMEGVFFRKCLYAAFMNYQEMNDIEDKSDYLNFAFTALNFHRQTFYVFSLSEHRDSLSMWRSYGNNGQGIAIGFDVNELSAATSGFSGCHFLKIIYRSEQNFINTFTHNDLELAYHAIEVGGEDLFCSVKYQDYEFLHDKYQNVKNICYSDEKEWRLVFDDELYKEKEFRERNGLIIPYYEIELPLNVIRCFVIGPCANQELSKSSLDSMLFHKARGFRENEDKIYLSGVPYVLR